MKEYPESLLGGYRVLDLTDEKGFFCGKVLSDLGAEVIKIERPGGDPSRNTGPFYHDIPDPERSLFWFAYNANKKGITLNIECADGKEIFKKLVRRADVVVESFRPGYLNRLGLGYAALSALHPPIIMASITPFGQEGPYKDYQATDMVAMAMGGWAYICGEDDRPPVTIGFPQSYLCAGGEAAVGVTIALYARELTGQGQQVDVSAQESVVMDTLNATSIYAMTGKILQRSSPYRVGFVREGVRQRQLWQCKDGFVIWMPMGGMAGAKENRAVVNWMASEGMASDFLKELEWEKWDIQQATTEFFARMEKEVAAFMLLHTKAELFEKAIQLNIILYPISDVQDLLENVQLRARNFWTEVDHPELGAKMTYPGPFIKLSETPIGKTVRAPRIGEHNEGVYKEVLGFSQEQLVRLKQAGTI